MDSIRDNTGIVDPIEVGNRMKISPVIQNFVANVLDQLKKFVPKEI
jgi:hypothetical protein